MQTLERDHTTVHHQQSVQQSDPKQNIYSPRPNATQRTGRKEDLAENTYSPYNKF